METAKDIIYKAISVEERLPDYATIHFILVGGMLPMMAQFRPSSLKGFEKGDWWTLGMSQATRIEEKKKCVTHWLELKEQSSKPTALTDDMIYKQAQKWVSNSPHIAGIEMGKWARDWMQEHKAEGWIAIDKKMPNDYEFVLIRTIDGSVFDAMYCDDINGATFHCTHLTEKTKISHWMLLNEPNEYLQQNKEQKQQNQ